MKAQRETAEVKHHLEQCTFSGTHNFLLRRGILKNGNSTVFGRLAQTYTMLMQHLTYVKARQFLIWHGCSSREGRLGRSTRRGAEKGWITVPSKAIQLWHSLGAYHNISLCLHKTFMQPLQPKEKFVCHDIPSVWRTRQSLGKVSHFPDFPVYCWFSITLLLDAPEKPQELPFW